MLIGVEKPSHSNRDNYVIIYVYFREGCFMERFLIGAPSLPWKTSIQHLEASEMPSKSQKDSTFDVLWKSENVS